MATTWEVDSIPCNCGYHKCIGVVSEGDTAFLYLGVHAVSQTQLTEWVTTHHEAVKQLVNLSRRAMGLVEV